MTRMTVAKALAILALPVGVGDAQQLMQPTFTFTGFETGMKVRVKAPRLMNEKLTGTIVYMSADSVVLDTVDQRRVERRFFPDPVLVESERRITLSTGDVDSVDISLGQSRLRSMMRIGRNAALIGGTIVGLGYVSGYQQPSFRNFAEGFRSGVKLGAVVGFSIGFAYGDEKWHSVGRMRPGWLAKN
jgi:hypothetical protein